MRLWLMWLSLALLLTACGRPDLVAHPDLLPQQTLEFGMPEVERFTLANGIRVYLREDHELPLVTVTAMVEAGAAGEPANRAGLAQLHAAALRAGGAGGRDPRQVDAALADLAADLAVSAESYATTLRLSVQDTDLSQGLGLMLDLLRHPRFAPEGVELARRQRLEAIRRENDQPSGTAFRALAAALYAGHFLGRSATPESVSAIGRDDLGAFHRRYFRPDNLWLAVSGAIDRPTLEALLQQLCGDWQPPAGAVQSIPELPPAASPAVWLDVRQLPQTTILLGTRGIDKDDPGLYALRVMDFILGGGGFNSRLMQEIRSNRGLAYSVYSHVQVGRRLPGMILMGCETKNETVAEVLGLMRNEMLRLAEEPVSEQELRLAKDSLINSFVFAFEDSHSVVTQVLNLDFYGYPGDFLDRYRERLAAVTAADVQSAARRHLQPERQEVVMVGAPPAAEGLAAELGLPLQRLSLQP